MTSPNTITRCSGSWLADGYRVGMGACLPDAHQIVLFTRPWYRRAWRWLRRMGRRPDGEWTVVAVTLLALTVLGSAALTLDVSSGLLRFWLKESSIDDPSGSMVLLPFACFWIRASRTDVLCARAVE